MMLEDFFTPTEMKDGLTAPSRVTELVTVMQKERDCVANTTRKWFTVVNAIAVTENRECLDLFIQLNGLWFIDNWLKEAQKFGNDTDGSLVEESITALLRALENLSIDNQKSVSSGVWLTVQNLLGHNSSRVQDRARVLFDSWTQDRDGDDGLTTVRENRAVDSELPECSPHDISTSSGTLNEGGNVNQMMPAVGMDDSQIQDDPPNLTVSSDILESVNGNHTIKEEPLINSEDSTVIRSDGLADIPELHEHTDDSKQMKKASSSEKLDVINKSSVSSPMEHTDYPTNADSATEFESKEDTYTTDPITVGSEGKKDDGESPKESELKEENTDVLQESSSDTVKSGESEDEDMEQSSSSEESERDSGNDSDVFKLSAEPKTFGIELDYDGMLDPLDIARQVAMEVEREVDCREPSPSISSSSEEIQPDSPDITSGNQSQPIEDIPKDLPNGSNLSAEALGHIVEEVSICENGVHNTESSQVLEAAEEPEVKAEKGFCGFDLNEELCADDFDMDNMNILVNSVSTPVSVVSTSRAVAVTGQPVAPLQFEGALGCVDDFDMDNMNIPVNSVSTPVSVVSTSRAAAVTGQPVAPLQFEGALGCADDFDMDNMNIPVNSVSTPISVVSASRAAAVTRQPVVPLQFEGALGWKGPAATSAFRPASSRRMVQPDNKTHNSSKQRQNFFDFDLNVTEGGEDKIAGKQIQNPILSGESSIEASSRRPERLHFDLNHSNDVGEVQTDWRRDVRLLPHRNGLQSPSRSSSSSSMQPSLRNFDLNDQPSSDHPFFGKPSLNLNSSSVISIMGAKVEVNKKDFTPLSNGRTLEPTMDSNMARTGGVLGYGSVFPYSHTPIYGAYNGLPPGPTMYGQSGPIPYMVDSRGAHIVSQMMGSTSALPPFMMSMTGPPQGTNGLGHLRQNFDLNSGMILDGGNRDPRDTGGLRQFIYPGQMRSIDEHLRANTQPSSSTSIGERRKEPDSGWEPYSYNYRHHQQPPWR